MCVCKMLVKPSCIPVYDLKCPMWGTKHWSYSEVTVSKITW